jgi:hypothetical protein
LGTECQYDAGPDETRSLARKRKFEEMKSDLTDLQELYEYLRERPLAEVAEVIRRIRSDADPCKVLRLVREGDLLLQASAIGRKGIEAADVEHIVDKLDDAAYRQSSIKVSAKQWTDVAGDGLVSELVSIFFDMEQPFATTYVDRHCFLEDMASEQIGSARFCSPALVNAICAIGAVSGKAFYSPYRLVQCLTFLPVHLKNGKGDRPLTRRLHQVALLRGSQEATRPRTRQGVPPHRHGPVQSILIFVRSGHRQSRRVLPGVL